jgi:aldehyde dehydrogenase
MTMSVQVNENLVREIVEEVLGRVKSKGPTPKPRAALPAPTRGAFGVFRDADRACEAAARAFEQLRDKGVAGRAKVVEIVKTLAVRNAKEWARIELEETKIGRLDHKTEKLEIMNLVPGVEFLRPDGWSGDHGITLEEFAPFGVIGAVTPSTHSIPTVSSNIIAMAAAGNAVVFNAHPSAAKCAAMAVRTYNQAIKSELGIENLACIVEEPTLESFDAICKSEIVRLLCVTGGPGVVKAAMGAGKRAICAGPGNPPVLVDDTADISAAAKHIVRGASYDNNLLCIGEKEVFAVESVFGRLMEALAKAGAAKLDAPAIERLTSAVFSFPKGRGAGCPDPVLNRDLVGKDASVLAKAAGVDVRERLDLLFGETDAEHPFVHEEQMMPFLPIVRVRSAEEGIEKARVAERGYRHTAIIHSRNVHHMTQMARALDTTLFVKNGPSMAGLGLGGEGYLSFTIATPTGEAVTSPRTFTRVRRCIMVDELRIF